jgi:hypothetical protein
VADLSAMLDESKNQVGGVSDIAKSKFFESTTLEKEHAKLREHYERARKKAVMLQEEVLTLRGMAARGKAMTEEVSSVHSAPPSV